jgi:hypothetical protein
MTEHDHPISIPRTLAWVALAVCATANAALSMRGASIVAHALVAVVTLLCLTTLIVSYVRGRGRP